MIVQSKGKIRGLNERVEGFNGVIQIAFTSVLTILPPADILYAVDPVGVEIIKPDAVTLVRKVPLM